jgi:nucleobase:cation symporter-1, NCS1 family
MTTTAAHGEEHVLEVEQYTIEQIPEDQRHGQYRDLFTVWFTSNLMPLTIVTGALATVVYGLPFVPAVLAIIVGNCVGAILMALHSVQGPKLGIPQMIQSRAQYGTIGSILVVGIVVFMYIGFFASNLILGGQSLNQLSSHISVNWGIVICAILSFVIVTYGYDMIHGLNRWLAIVFTAVMVIAVIIMIARGLGPHFMSTGKFSWTGFMGSAIVTGVLWQIAYAPYVSDYSRYMPKEQSAKPVFWYTYFGVVLGSVLPMIIGAMVGIASKDASQVAGIKTLTGGFGWVVMIVFAVGIINTNTLNAYGGVLCAITVGQNFKSDWFPKAKARIVFCLIFIAICLVGAIAYQTTFLTSYYNFILLLTYLLIPWTVINLIDFYVIHRGNYDVPSLFRADGGVYGRFDVGTVLVYLIGFAIEMPFVNTTFYEGPVAKHLNGTDISWLVGIVVVTPLYYFYAKWDLKRKEGVTPESMGAIP